MTTDEVLSWQESLSTAQIIIQDYMLVFSAEVLIGASVPVAHVLFVWQ